MRTCSIYVIALGFMVGWMLNGVEGSSSASFVAGEDNNNSQNRGVRAETVWVRSLTGYTGDTVQVEFYVQSEITPIDAFSISFRWNSYMLHYQSCTPGELNPGWLMFGCGLASQNQMSLAGFSISGSLPPGSSGCIARVTFDVTCTQCVHGDSSALEILWASDDLYGFQTINGVFTFGFCFHHGDVNGDGQHSAGDAQLTFYIALGMYTPTFDEECAADCNASGDVTASDAQQVFSTLFHGTCADPMLPSF